MANEKKLMQLEFEREYAATFKRLKDDTRIDFDEGWSFIQRGMPILKSNLLSQQSLMYSSEICAMIHATIYNMHNQKDSGLSAQKLHDGYKDSLKEYINTTIFPALREKHHEFMLREMVKQWDNYKLVVRRLSHVFEVLDRDQTNPNVNCLNVNGLMLFHDLVYAEMKNTVKESIITLINREREGEQFDEAVFKNVVKLFVEMGMGSMDAYEEDFEHSMLIDTAAYYSRKAESWIKFKENDYQDYMQLEAQECFIRDEERVVHYLQERSKCLKREKERVGHILHSSSQRKLLDCLDCCEQTFITENVNFQHQMEIVAFRFRQRVTDEVKALVKLAEDVARNEQVEKKDSHGSQEHLQAFVRKVIDIHDKYFQYVRVHFVNYNIFRKALKEEFDMLCNKGVSGRRISEWFATFCDILFKKKSSNLLSNETIEDTIEKVGNFLHNIEDKDLFAEFYRKKLQSRLLFNKNINYDHERSILTKLKEQCGWGLTRKMEGLVTDLTRARETQTLFTDYLRNNSLTTSGIDLTVTVLNRGLWQYKSSDIALPVEMVECVGVFKEFYHKQTKHTKLSWVFSLGTCNIVGQFESRAINLNVTTYQAAVLLLFNRAERMSYADIKGQLNLTDGDIVKLLYSLSCAKYKILIKDPSTKTISYSDSFEFNTKFTDKMSHIKIPLLPVDDICEKKVIETVDKDRRYAIDASIVRIMKRHKILPCHDLVLVCAEQLAWIFKADLRLIKKRIEELIRLEYLERDKDTPNIIRYSA